MGQKVARMESEQMHRIMGVFDVFSVGYGDLGSSIYYALGITALYALGATPIALLLAGLTFVCTALTYAEMSSVMEESGGSASFSRKAFNDLISFIAGWALLLDYIVTISISAYSVVPYLSFFLSYLNDLPVKLAFSSILIALMIWMNIRGSKQSAFFSMTLTFLSVVTQLILVVIGFFTLVHFKEFFSHLKIGGSDTLWSPSWGNFWRGTAMAMVAYTGIESMAQLSGEAKNPTFTVPRAMMMAMGMLLFMYLGLSVVSLSAITPELLSTKYLEAPIAGIISVFPIGQSFLAPWISALAAVLLIVAANAGLLGSSRLAFNMGEYLQLPKFFYTLHPKYKTPAFAILFFGTASIILIILSWGRLTFLADLYNFGAMLAFFSAHLSIIMHRIRYPDMKRPFRIPWNITISGKKIPITAILGAFSTIFVWLLVVITKPDGRYLGIVWLILGLVMYFLYRRKYKLSPTAQVEIEKIQIKDYKNVTIKKILLPTRGHLATETVIIASDLAKLFNAEITIVHVMELPYIFPAYTPILQREKYSDAILKRAYAIGLEKKVNINTKIIRAHSVVQTISELVQKEEYDLLILGAGKTGPLSAVTEQILTHVKCRTWICRPSKSSTDIVPHLYQKTEKV